MFILLRLVELAVTCRGLKSIIIVRLALRADKGKVICALSIRYAKLRLRSNRLPHPVRNWSHFLYLLKSLNVCFVLLSGIFLSMINA